MRACLSALSPKQLLWYVTGGTIGMAMKCVSIHLIQSQECLQNYNSRSNPRRMAKRSLQVGPQSLSSSAYLTAPPPSECGDCGDPLETLSLESLLQAITAQQRKRAGNGGQAGFLLPLQRVGQAGGRRRLSAGTAAFSQSGSWGCISSEHAKLLTHLLQVCLEYDLPGSPREPQDHIGAGLQLQRESKTFHKSTCTADRTVSCPAW